MAYGISGSTRAGNILFDGEGTSLRIVGSGSVKPAYYQYTSGTSNRRQYGYNTAGFHTNHHTISLPAGVDAKDVTIFLRPNPVEADLADPQFQEPMETENHYTYLDEDDQITREFQIGAIWGYNQLSDQEFTVYTTFGGAHITDDDYVDYLICTHNTDDTDDADDFGFEVKTATNDLSFSSRRSNFKGKKTLTSLGYSVYSSSQYGPMDAQNITNAINGDMDTYYSFGVAWSSGGTGIELVWDTGGIKEQFKYYALATPTMERIAHGLKTSNYVAHDGLPNARRKEVRHVLFFFYRNMNFSDQAFRVRCTPGTFRVKYQTTSKNVIGKHDSRSRTIIGTFE